MRFWCLVPLTGIAAGLGAGTLMVLVLIAVCGSSLVAGFMVSRSLYACRIHHAFKAIDAVSS